MSVLLAYQLMKRVLEEVNEDSDKLRHDPVCRDLEMEAHILLTYLETASYRID